MSNADMLAYGDALRASHKRLREVEREFDERLPHISLETVDGRGEFKKLLAEVQYQNDLFMSLSKPFVR